MNRMIDDYRSLFEQQTPLLDLRAPVEFDRGAFNLSKNLPLMSDDERAQVGLCYKQRGQQAAITLGHSLVAGDIRAERMAGWLAFCAEHADGVFYCFRGGLRSQTVQRWLHEAGVDVPIVRGGYKALRNFLLNELEQLARRPLVLLAGNTGSGKTELLQRCSSSLDLEGAANHRGSSFGAYVSAQVKQINFENRLAEQYVRLCASNNRNTLVLEDEGRLIGSVHLPLSLQQAMKAAPVVVVQHSFDYRLERLYQEYVLAMQQSFIARDGVEQGALAFADYLQQGLFKVRKRLGALRYNELASAMNDAVAASDMRAHLNWLEPLLKHYYDPMYQYQLSQKQQRIVFQGPQADCLAYLAALP